jgi:hypothetical protein
MNNSKLDIAKDAIENNGLAEYNGPVGNSGLAENNSPVENNSLVENLIENLNNSNVEKRLESLRELSKLVNDGKIPGPERGNDVNNHIHTTYSFSPYSPSKAIWMAYRAGLMTAGIMDHDSISGAMEFIEAGKILGIATTIGVECRADFSKTQLKGRKINNPDQDSIAYVALHGIPHNKIDDVKKFFAPYAGERNKRNSLMVSRLNRHLEPHNIHIDYESEVVPLSKRQEGGSVTERHILFALACALTDKLKKGTSLVDFLKKGLGIDIKPRIEKYLLDTSNKYYEYDLLGVLKSDLLEKFYVDAAEECPDIRELIDFSNSIGAISAYAYLGDVTDSVTGDKKTQKFEDDYIELLFEVIKELGFNAVTYMPSRNTIKQLKRVKDLCCKYDFFQVSGEDINSPRQPFVCTAMRDREFENLVDSTWALVGHEKAATDDIRHGMFSRETISKFPDLDERIRIYKEIGLSSVNCQNM